eukprot:607069-Pelagomonas_calceolata.AAC.9
MAASAIECASCLFGNSQGQILAGTSTYKCCKSQARMCRATLKAEYDSSLEQAQTVSRGSKLSISLGGGQQFMSACTKAAEQELRECCSKGTFDENHSQ